MSEIRACILFCVFVSLCPLLFDREDVNKELPELGPS